jgi:hypothetical protein
MRKRNGHHEAARFHRGSWRCGGVASSGARANLPVFAKILNGAQASDLPIEQPIKFELRLLKNSQGAWSCVVPGKYGYDNDSGHGLFH